jgi:hypothetical protein
MIKQETINKISKYVILAYIATRVAGFLDKGIENVSIFSLSVISLLFCYMIYLYYIECKKKA